MSQATRRWIAQKVQSLRESNVLPFHDILDAKRVEAALAAEGVTFHERIYTPLVTTCLFLSQVLDPDHSCRARSRGGSSGWRSTAARPAPRRPAAPATHAKSSRSGPSSTWSIRPPEGSRIVRPRPGPGRVGA